MRKLILFLSLFLTIPTFANNVMYGSPSLVTVTSTSQQVLAQNSLRSYLLIVNTGANTIYTNFGAPGSATGIPIYPGDNYEPPQAPSNSIYLDCPTGSFAKVLQGQ